MKRRRVTAKTKDGRNTFLGIKDCLKCEMKEPPLVYLWIYKKIKEWHGCHIVRTTNLIPSIRRIVYQIPKRYNWRIILELQKYKLVEVLDADRVNILNNNLYENKLKKLGEYFYW